MRDDGRAQPGLRAQRPLKLRDGRLREVVLGIDVLGRAADIIAVKSRAGIDEQLGRKPVILCRPAEPSAAVMKIKTGALGRLVR